MARNMVLELAPEWRGYDDYLAALTGKYRNAAKKIAHAERLHALYLGRGCDTAVAHYVEGRAGRQARAHVALGPAPQPGDERADPALLRAVPHGEAPARSPFKSSES